MPLLDEPTQRLLAAAHEGLDVANHLDVGGLLPGDVGVLEVTVRHIAAPRTFQKKRGGDGMLCRITVADATGEVDLVLWDDELTHLRDGTLEVGQRVRIGGASVRAGWKGGVELGLGHAILEVLPAETQSLTGRLAELSETRIIDGDPVRFQADVILDTEAGPVTVVLWDDVVRAARGILPGARVRIDDVVPHPEVDGRFVAQGRARLRQC